MLARLISLTLVTLVLSPIRVTGQDLKVLLIAKEDSSADLELMLSKEVSVMTDMLREAGYEVVVASPAGEPLVAGELTVTPDLKYADVEVAEYAGVMMPCMAVGFEVPLQPELAAIIEEAISQGKPIAAQVSSVILLAKAGVLSGKKYAFIEDWAAEQSVLDNAVLSGHGIVKDGNIITSGVCPYAAKETGLEDGTSALTQALIREMKGEE